MKVLLDENLDHRLRNHLGTHEVFTVSHMGWSGLKNGKLLEAVEKAGFNVFVTGDRSLPLEQNLGSSRIGIVTLSSIEWRIVRDHLEPIINAIDRASPGSIQAVNCGTFQRKRSQPL